MAGLRVFLDREAVLRHDPAHNPLSYPAELANLWLVKTVEYVGAHRFDVAWSRIDDLG
jgi:hypothetical protein